MRRPTPPPFLSKSQVRRLESAAVRQFVSSEDREDFLQWAYLFALERIREKDLGDRGEKTYILDIRFIVLEARRALLATQRGKTGSRSAEILAKEDWTPSFDRIEHQTFADMTDALPPQANSRDQAVDRNWRLELDDGTPIFFSYDEIAELRRCDRHSAIVSRSKGYCLPFWEHSGKLFLGPKELAAVTGFSAHKIKTSVRKVTLRWASKKIATTSASPS